MDELKEVIACHLRKIKNESVFLVSIQELSAMAGVKKSNIYNCFNGKASIDSMLKVLHVLDLELFAKFSELVKNEN